MAQPPITRTQAEQALALLETHGTISRAAAAAGLPRGTFENRVKRARVILSQPEISAPPPPPSPRLPVTADEAWELLDGWIGRKRIPKVTSPTWQAKAEQHYVIAGDFHAPFHDPDIVAQLITEESGKTDTLIISGDLMDFYSISRFIKYEHIPIEQEIAGADALLAQLAAAFPDVLISPSSRCWRSGIPTSGLPHNRRDGSSWAGSRKWAI